jgi:hypothetical protein
MAMGKLVLIFNDPDKTEDELYAEIAEHASNADFSCIDHDIIMGEDE